MHSIVSLPQEASSLIGRPLSLPHLSQAPRMGESREDLLKPANCFAGVCEAYTSKTVSWTGEVKKIGGAKRIKSNLDGQVMDRDWNGARGIFLRALGDIPWMQKHLAFVSNV